MARILTEPTAPENQFELAIAIADYIENFHKPTRGHSSLGYLAPAHSKIYTRPRQGWSGFHLASTRSRPRMVHDLRPAGSDQHPGWLSRRSPCTPHGSGFRAPSLLSRPGSDTLLTHVKLSGNGDSLTHLKMSGNDEPSARRGPPDDRRH